MTPDYTPPENAEELMLQLFGVIQHCENNLTGCGPVLIGAALIDHYVARKTAALEQRVQELEVELAKFEQSDLFQ